MVITKLYIRGFGKFKDFEVTPSKGFNVIFGENESGKSTLMAFIKSCFYGVGGKNDLREKYRPHDGTPMSGYALFEHNGITYKIDRTFGTTAAKDTTELWNTLTGQKEVIPSKISVGEYLFGISENTFLNTLYIGQSKLDFNKNSNEIIDKLNNLSSANDEEISYKDVYSRLDRGAKYFKSRSQDCVFNRLTAQYSELKSKEIKLNEKCAFLSSEIEKLSDDKTQLNNINSEILKTENLRNLAVLKIKKEKLKGINEISERLEKAEESLKKAKEKIIFKGSPLTHDDIRERAGTLEHLESLDAEIGRLLENLSTIEGRKKELEASIREYPEIIENEENIRRLDVLYNDKNAEEKFNNSKKAVGFNVITLIISVTLLIIGFLLSQRFGTVSIIAGVILAVLAFAFGCSIRVKPKIKYKQELENKNSQFLTDCRCNSVEELLAKASQIQKDKMQLDAVLMQHSKVTKIISEKRQELARTDSEMDTFFNEFCDSSSGLKPEEFLDLIDDNILLFEEAEHKAEYCKNEFSRATEDKSIEDVRLELLKTENILGENSDTLDDNPPEFYNNILSALNTRKNEITEKIALLSINEKELSEVKSLIKENKAAIEETEEKLKSADEEYSAFQTAINVLNESLEEMQKNFSPKVNSKTGEILSCITNGKYNDIYISKALSPSVDSPEDGRTYEIDNFSGGTIDQIYLALRLAIADVIFDENKLPLMLDDSFLQFDNERMKSAAKYVAAIDTQAFVFTCRKEDANILKTFGANLINL